MRTSLLPISPFTETAGTFVSCEGRAQRFNGVVKPFGETRPAWKVLRVLGSMLDLPGFDFESIDDVRAQLPDDPATRSEARERHACGDHDARLPAPGIRARRGCADLLRGSTRASRAVAAGNRRRAAPARPDECADAAADRRRRRRRDQGAAGSRRGGADRNGRRRGPAGIVRIAAAHPSTCGLEGLSGPIAVERI